MKKNWINCGKTIAIFAVLIDHMNGVLYTNQTIAWFSYFSVTLFVLFSGVTSYYSISKHENSHEISEIGRRVFAIIKPYSIATAMYLIIITRSFNLYDYIKYLLGFNISAPFYFIVFYIQLVIISPILYNLIHKVNRRRYAFILYLCIISVLCFIAYLAINYTFILEVHGGGRYLFGGTYLPVFYLGMLFAHFEPIFITIKQNVKYIFLSVLLLFGWFFFIINNKLAIDQSVPFGSGFNPPSISLIIYGILWFLVIFCIVNLEKYIKNNVFNVVIKSLSKLGNYSLNIFLYHPLKQQHIVVNPYYSSSKPQYVIRIILSTCLVAVILMTVEPSIPLASGYLCL